MKVKVKNLHYINDKEYSDHVKNIYNMAKSYPERTETHHQLDKLNYHINHKLIVTENALSAITYSDNDSVVIAELNLLNDGRVYEVIELIKDGVITYAEVEELGVVNE